MLQSTDIQLHRAAEADAEGIAAVHVHSWQAAYKGLVPQAYLEGLRIADRAASWRREMAALPEDRRPWVALLEESVRGFVVAGPSRDDDCGPETAEVYALYVDPECWDHGVGRALKAVLLWTHQVSSLRHGGYDATLCGAPPSRPPRDRRVLRGGSLESRRGDAPITVGGAKRWRGSDYRLDLA